MQKLIVPDVAMWSVWQADRNVFFNSYFIKRPAGNVVIDPLSWAASDEQEMRCAGGVASVIITNRDHERKAGELAQLFGAELAAGEKDIPLLQVPVDRALRDGDEAFDGASVIGLEGLKSPGEIAIHMAGQRTAIVGDALWGDPAGSLRLLPDDKLIDPKRAVLSLRRLWALQLDTLLVGDGACIFGSADSIIGECLQSREDVYVNRINLEDAPAKRDRSHDGRYECSDREIGLLIGARKLGYRVSTVPPGKRFCPMHAHAVEEEMFLIWEGEATIRTPRGEVTCRRGDVIAFPTGDRGAHQLVNRSDADCTVFMLGANEPNEVAYYPESKKVLLRSRGRLILRSEPALDYFDGE